jgi:tetratricopeptide (TPR) repeat protein
VRSGWLARARALLEEAGVDRPEHGWVLIIKAFFEPDAQVREAQLREAIAVGRRFGDPDIEFLALAYLGSLYVMIDRVEEGLAFSDEALAALCAGELTELATIDEIFCGLFWSCELVNDVPRADQWIRAAAERLRYSNVVAAFCRAHYGGILTAAGRWQEAETQLVEATRHFDGGLSPRRAAAIIRLADLHIRQGHLEEAELAEQLWVEPGRGLVGRPQAVAERLDDVVGGHPQVGHALLEQPQHRPEHAAGGRHLGPLGRAVRRDPVVVAEQLVGAVDQEDAHGPPA